MNNTAILYSKTEKNFRLEVYTKDNIEFVEINDKLVPIEYINLQKFERYEIIK